MDVLDLLAQASGFEWDEHNAQKIWLKHKVTPTECEEIFFNLPLVAAEDAPHSKSEPRFFVLGRTDGGRLLFAAFTLRRDLIRVISARAMSRRERKEYESHE